MKRLPNPFLNNQREPHNSSPGSGTPGFLLLTPSGMSSYQREGRSMDSNGLFARGRSSNRGFVSKFQGLNREDSGNGHYSANSRGTIATDRRYDSPPANTVGSPFNTPHGYIKTPTGRHQDHFQTNRANFSNRGSRQRGGRYANKSFGRGGTRDGFGGCDSGKGPLSDVPIEKFVSNKMLQDPWNDLLTETEIAASLCTNAKSAVPVLLDNSKIIIDSDISVNINSSSDESNNSDGDSSSESPVHGSGSNVPFHLTSSSEDEP